MKRSISYKVLAVAMATAVAVSFSGCGLSRESTGGSTETTETTFVEPDTSLAGKVDSDGYRIYNDYVETVAYQTNIYESINEEVSYIELEGSTDTDKDEGVIYITVNKGVQLKRIGVKGDWTMISLNDRELFVKTSDVKETTVDWYQEPVDEVNNHTVFIDPTKQMIADNEMEFLDESGESEKEKSKSGAIGVSTGSFEYEICLAVAIKLKEELEGRGYTVFISRESNDVSISNQERAKLANQYGSEIFIRISATEISDSDTSGLMGIVNSNANLFTGNNYKDSYTLADYILNETCRETGAPRCGIYESDNITALNWCNMPAAVVNVGFLSNSTDDENLSRYEYQDKLAKGIATGIDSYFAEKDAAEE